MICYKCNGTGYYDIDNKCPFCDGTGEYEPFDSDVELDKLYPMEEQTNYEWLRSIGTREFAKELALLVLYDMPLYDRLHNVFEGGESAVIDECEKWLKEIHHAN